MGKYTVNRILSSLVTIFLVITLTFFLMQLVPGGPFQSEKPRPEVEAKMKEKYGLDQPLIVQYQRYMSNLLRFDLGVSYKMRLGEDVVKLVAARLPTSFKLGMLAFCIAVLIGIPLGLFTALKSGSWMDRLIVSLCSFGISVPNFILATILMLAIGVQLKWLPFIGLKTWQSYIMPVTCMGIYPMAFIVRLMRSNMLDVISQDYMKTARAKGLPEYVILFKHGMRNAMLPVITYLGALFAGIITGSFVIEKIFSIAGLGKYFVESISGRDYPLIMGTTIFYGIMIITANLVVDLLYGVIDPRVKHI